MQWRAKIACGHSIFKQTSKQTSKLKNVFIFHSRKTRDLIQTIPLNSGGRLNLLKLIQQKREAWNRFHTQKGILNTLQEQKQSTRLLLRNAVDPTDLISFLTLRFEETRKDVQKLHSKRKETRASFYYCVECRSVYGTTRRGLPMAAVQTKQAIYTKIN